MRIYKQKKRIFLELTPYEQHALASIRGGLRGLLHTDVSESDLIKGIIKDYWERIQEDSSPELKDKINAYASSGLTRL
jgi:hypothetical protein